jgi:hypothetical protein
MYSITGKGIFSGAHKIKDMSSLPKSISLAYAPGNDPVIVIKTTDKILFETISGKNIGEIAAKQAMHYNGSIYSVFNGRMIENNFVAGGNGNILHTTKPISNIFESAIKLYNGVALQDILGKCWAVIPYQKGRCFNGPIKELDNLRIIDAKFEHHVLIVIAEKGGQYHRYTICFDEAVATYTCRIENDVQGTMVNFTCLSNGVCVHQADDETIEVFRTNDKVKEVKDPPITTDMRLMNDSTGIVFINKNGLYSLKLK